MLNPVAVNLLSGINGFETPTDNSTKTARAIRAAWQNDRDRREQGSIDSGQPFPIAFYPHHIHPRLQVQQSCFTIHAPQEKSLEALLTEAGNDKYLVRLPIVLDYHDHILFELRLLGISHATLFPDLEGVATDLTKLFWKPPFEDAAGTK